MSSTTSRPTVIALVDANTYYIECERLFSPKLKGKPVVVLSNNDGNAVAVSEEAKALGVARGAPARELRALVRRHGLHVLSSNYAVYGDLSARLMAVLGQFAPRVEVYSIDEAFLDLSGWSETAALAHARGLVTTVRQWLGLPVSVGIGPTKVLAKVANRIAKRQKVPGGVVALLERDAQTQALADLKTAELWGIAGRWSAKLQALGIETALQLRDADPPWLRSVFGVVMERIAYELRGVSCLALEEVAPPKQQIVASRSFGRPVTDLGELREAVAYHVTRAAVRLRRQRSEAGGLQVAIGTDPFAPDDPPYHTHCTVELASPTADTRPLIGQAMRGLVAIYRPGFRYKKAGVMLLSLTPADRRQGSLFRPGDPARAAAHDRHRWNQRADGAGDRAVRDGGLRARLGDAPSVQIAGLHHALGRAADREIARRRPDPKTGFPLARTQNGRSKGRAIFRRICWHLLYSLYNKHEKRTTRRKPEGGRDELRVCECDGCGCLDVPPHHRGGYRGGRRVRRGFRRYFHPDAPCRPVRRRRSSSTGFDPLRRGNYHHKPAPAGFRIARENAMPNSNSDHSRQLRATTARERNSRLVREGHSRFSVMLGPEATAALAAIQEKTGESKAESKAAIITRLILAEAKKI